MKKLFVLDFDKTLIPYDSWNLFLRKVFRKSPLRIGVVLFFRALGLISRKEMKRRITDVVTNGDGWKSFSREFVRGMAKDIQFPSQLLEGGDDRQVVVLTASPMCYMCYLNEFLDFECVVAGSDYFDDKYTEMRGEQKCRYLHSFFPPEQYKYEYALSDSDSDMVWMKEFEHYELKK